jgi:hypothetical protein
VWFHIAARPLAAEGVTGVSTDCESLSPQNGTLANAATQDNVKTNPTDLRAALAARVTPARRLI